jgi:hypothetical protein
MQCCRPARITTVLALLIESPLSWCKLAANGNAPHLSCKHSRCLGTALASDLYPKSGYACMTSVVLWQLSTWTTSEQSPASIPSAQHRTCTQQDHTLLQSTSTVLQTLHAERLANSARKNCAVLQTLHANTAHMQHALRRTCTHRHQPTQAYKGHSTIIQNRKSCKRCPRQGAAPALIGIWVVVAELLQWVGGHWVVLVGNLLVRGSCRQLLHIVPTAGANKQTQDKDSRQVSSTGESLSGSQ